MYGPGRARFYRDVDGLRMVEIQHENDFIRGYLVRHGDPEVIKVVPPYKAQAYVYDLRSSNPDGTCDVVWRGFERVG